jgi:23S rRNA (uracil1939-C5)-methyltransferase
VVGIEAGEEAVVCFQANIQENALRNVTAVRGTVEANLEAAKREIEGKAVSIVVDPPREGMRGDVIGFLKEVQVRNLVYVSCDPSTLARDLKRLGPGFTLTKITPLDMFPQTRHIEAVAVLKKRGQAVS